jgi:large subunit ribosomal protein L4
MDVPVYNMKGSQVSTLTVDEQDLGGEVNAALLKQAYVRYHANQRQGSARTKNRHEVEGSTRKIYKQKGTGNARHASRTANLFRGGGHTFAKRRTREDYRLDMPKKMRRKANRNALLAKLIDNEIRIVDRLEFSTPKTREFQGFLAALKIDRSALVALPVDGGEAKNARLSARNIDDVTLTRADQLNCFELLNHRYLVIGREELENWLKGPWSQTGKDAKVSPMGRVEADGAERSRRPARGNGAGRKRRPAAEEVA